MATQQEIIQKLMKSLVEAWSPLNGGVTHVGAVDIAFKAASDDSRRKFNSMQEVIDAFLTDCKNAESVDQFLREKCGIILDNEDNGSITGLDIGGTKIKTDESIVPENTSPTDLVELYRNADIPDTLTEEILLSSSEDPDLKIVPHNSGTISEKILYKDLQFTKKGLTVTVQNYNGIIESAESGDDEAKRKLIVINGLYSWWIEGALQLIKDSYGDEFSFEENNRTITVVLHNDKNSAPAAVNAVNAIDFLQLSINMYYLSTISSNNLNGNMTVSGHYLDHTLTHELTHAIMAAKFGSVSGDFKWWQLPRIIVEGTAELTKGIDKIRKNDMLDAIEKHRSNGYLADILDYDTRYESDNTRQGAQYAGGYMLLRYLAKQCATEETTPITIGASKSITCTSDDGMLVKANNGVASLQKNDALVTDSSGNISTIIIGNKDNIIATPESKTMVVVKDHNNNDIASIFGSASVHDNGFIQKNFSAIDVKAQIDNATVVGSNEKDEIVIDGINASITSNDGDDIIKVNGNGAEILTSDGLNEITVTGDGAYINGGQSNDIIVLNGNGARNRSFYNVDISGGIFANTGNDEILINGDNNAINAGKGNDTVNIYGNSNEINGGNGADRFIFTAESKNNTIGDFDSGANELHLESNGIAAEIQINDEVNSVVISSAKTGDTLVVLFGITSGSNDNIVYFTDDGNTVRTSIDWLLANTTPINPKPDDTGDTQTINVQPNGNVNNTRDDVIINAVSGNNVIQNSGSNVRISGGTDKDEVTNNGNNVTIDGKSGNDVISNGSNPYKKETIKGGDNVVINGGEGFDLIYNYDGLNVQLNAAEGDDTINNTGNNVQITGDSGNDEIRNNGGDTVTVDGGEGNDHVYNSGNDVLILGGNGEDSIRNNGGNAVTIDGGNGDDTISNAGSNALIEGSTGNDYVYNSGNNSTINGGNGEDYIRNYSEGSRVLIYGGENNDKISNSAENVTIDGGSGNDSIDNNATNVSIFGGDGKDSIINRSIHANNVTIDGGLDDDYVSNFNSGILIFGGSGNDSIDNNATNVSIFGGDGKDSIINRSIHANNVTIDGGLDDDYVSNFNSGILIFGGEGNDSISNYHANNVTINGDSGNDSIENSGEQVIIEAGEGNDTISNIRKEVSINGGAGDDSIENDHGASNATIDGGDGNDFIINKSSNAFINAGDGNDVIRDENRYSYTTNSTIWGGAGNDSISSANWDVTINGGTGDDTIDIGGGRVLITYSNGDGNDVINGFSSNDTLSITGGEYSLRRYDKNTIILTVGTGNITLHGEGELSIFDNIIGTLASDNNDKPDTTPADTTPADTTPADTTPADTTPADTTPADTTPADTIPTDTTPADTTPSGQDQVVPVQIIRNLTGIDINHLEKVIVTDTDSLDDIIAERTVWLNFSTDSSKGVQNVDLSKSPYRQVVSLEGGNQKVQFSDENGNVAIVDASATGSKNIIFGNGDALGIFYSPNANISATVGSGKDSILVDNNARVQVDMTNSDNAQIVPYSGRVILDNYNPDSRAGIILPEVTNITDSIKDNSINFTDDVIRVDSASIKFNSDDDSIIANLMTDDGSTQKVAFTKSDGGSIDTSQSNKPHVLIGNKNNDKSNGSNIKSGKSNDSVFGGSNDSIDAGAGKNLVSLYNDDNRAGATVSLTEGRTTIEGMNNTLAESKGDKLSLDVSKFKNLKLTNGNLVITGNNFYGLVENADLLDGNYTTQFITNTNNDITYKVAIGGKDSSIRVTEDDDVRPNAFFGDHSEVDFSNYSGDAIIDLKGDLWNESSINGAPAFFDGINSLRAGNGNTIFKGSDANETFFAGKGNTSLYGDGGSNLMVGYTGSDKEGSSTFFVLANANNAANTIRDFEFVYDDNYTDNSKVTADQIEILPDINFVNYVGVRNNNLYIEIANKQNPDVIERVEIENAIDSYTGFGKNIRVSGLIAQVGTNKLLFDQFANYYLATKSNATVFVDSSLDFVNLWLDEPNSGKSFEGDIKVIDARQSNANAELVGNNNDNVIYAGTGETSLWGGFGGNDLLVGNSSKDSFYYGIGNGNDTIQNVNDGDNVILLDVSLDQIIDANITADAVTIKLNDGGSLKINGSADVTYQLADGSKYSANHEHLEWDSR